MQSENYRKRAGEVRRTARANLLEIRQARMARKAALLEGATATSMADTADKIAIPDQTHGTPEDTIAPLAVAETEVVAEFDALDELAVKNAALAEINSPGEPEVEPPSATAATETVEVEASNTESEQGDTVLLAASESDLAPTEPVSMPSEEDWAQSELAALPGAGPGLVWMLGQCNVSTLAQLAQEDPSDLSTKLGVVGQILDVSQWISFAQETGDS